MVEAAGASRELDRTPTWAVAAVCAVIVVVSIFLEKILHKIGHVFQEKKKKALFEALEKIKGELMVLGFISLILTFGQNYISKICIPTKLADTMLPCANKHDHHDTTHGDHEHHHRRLLWNDRRSLAGDSEGVGCKAGFVPLISYHGLHQLHIFIFFLAIFHVIQSCITMTLGRLKIRGWKEWERQTEDDNEFSNDPSRFRLTHETSFVKDHNSYWTKTAFSFYLVCFFRQFFRSVRRADYLTMRHGFVTVHLAPGSKFDFQKYIKRSLEDDFKVVVGISPLLWASVVVFLLMNVSGWHAMFWETVIPLLLILAVGTKLQAIITQMALEIQERHAVVQGIPLVQVSDRNFWFSWPELLLYIIHFVLFQNAFELTYFFWIWLMVLGFISLILTFGQNYISKICIPTKLADTMLPCANKHDHHDTTHGDHEHHHRRLLWNDRRSLAGDSEGVGCKAGFVPLISYHGLHQLHIFIFFLAIFHVIQSCITMTLGRLKIRGWKEWERQTEDDNEFSNDPSRFRLTHETSFVKDHNSYWTKTAFSFYLVCFFRQFFRSVRRADYLTMRHGFVTVHLAPGSKFDFQKYIKRSLEDDFKVVVGISPLLWASVVVFLLMNVSGWHAMFWETVIPLLLILAVGTKLQAIITQMALEIQERHAVVQGIPLVQVSDRNFWFSWPELLLYIIHFVLFQNAFELTYFFWIWLMVLGFISLILTFGQNYISKICIPTKLADTMLPCANKHDHHDTTHGDHEHHHRRLLWNDRRSLAGDSEGVGCKAGFVPLISYHGLHQLHIFIFFLAIFHVIQSCITMTLGRLKIRGWKEWERQTEDDNEFSNDPSRFRLTHETSFVKDHNSYWTKTAFSFYLVCFFRQFFRSVRRADYLTMRHGFVTVHLAPGSKFDFQKYIKRSLEDDFKVVVGISPLLWASVVVFLLMNVSGWHAMFWETVIPLLLILAVGTKLQAIITQMALEIQERHAVVQGIPLVQVSDRNFWFSWPELLLYIIHFVLFQNAFELTYFFWIWYEFGLKSCFHEDFEFIILRVAMGFGVQTLCSYITLPLYALVTQMGSTMKRSIFDEQTSKALKSWHMKALKKKTEGGNTKTLGGDSPVARPPRSVEMNTSEEVMTSIDLHEEEEEAHYGKRDLLTGP